MCAGDAPGLFRFPAVSRTHFAFIYLGQLWVAPRDGSAAVQLTSTPTRKFDPRFSPDGRTIAFSDNVAGNAIDVFTIPLSGGTPTRITNLPSHQVLCQWTADDRLLFYTNALSFNRIEMQLYTVPSRGGLETKLPLAYGSEGSIDDRGEWLAYTPQWPNSLISGWKRYRGGMAAGFRLYNLRTHASVKTTSWSGTDARPMWHGTALYYVSDAGTERRLNIWAYDIRTRGRRQVTHFRDYDVRFPTMGPREIIFQYGPELRLLDLQRGTTSTPRIAMPFAAAPPLRRDVDASRFITRRQLASGGGVILAEARGDLWMMPMGSGAPRNLTATSGAFEREAALSPDSQRIAYFSDVTGEYQLYIRDAEGKAAPRQITHFTSGFRYRPAWSSDSRRLAFADNAGAIYVCDSSDGGVKRIDTDPWAQQPELAWSPDSTWLAYTRTSRNRLSALWRYDVADGVRRLLSTEQFNVATPVFAPDGERLFFISNRDFTSPMFDYFGARVAYRPTAVLMAVPLRVTNPAEFERHGIRLPLSKGAIAGLATTSDGDPVYGLTDLTGALSVRRYDMRDNREQIVAEGTNDFNVAPDGRHILFAQGDHFAVKEIGSVSTHEIAVSTAGMTVSVDLRAEWAELFDDAWRLFRDFLYAPQHKLADWNGVRRHYRVMLERCGSRDDVNYVLSEMIGESSTGHAYLVSEGDAGARPPANPIGLLGADFVLDRGAVRIARIYEGAPWDDAARSPLRQNGNEVREGEYLLAVNGTPIDVARDPRAAFLGLAGRPVTITIGSNPKFDAAARQVVVTPLDSENNIRYRHWVERNRRHVEETSNGRIGYIHIPDFSMNGLNEFVRQYYGQVGKDALIIDPRWSQGGWTGAIMAEFLARTPLNYAAERYSSNVWPSPRQGAHFGPKCLLVNHMVISAGENFSYYFRKLHLGPIVGTRTWGGLTGLNGNPALIDGGSVNVPNAPFFDRGAWLIENHGLEPDVVITDDPARPAGRDPQLEAAIQAMGKALAARPYVPPSKP